MENNKEKTVLDALFDYFDNSPLMSDNRLNIDYLPEDTSRKGVEYALSVSPTDETIQKYLDGGARCRHVFTISSVADDGPDVAAAISNAGFIEQLAKWMRQQTRLRILPELPEGLDPLRIKAIGAGYLYQPMIDAGKYQIQCELEYYRKGDY
jgi:hypothetical protein